MKCITQIPVVATGLLRLAAAAPRTAGGLDRVPTRAYPC